MRYLKFDTLLIATLLIIAGVSIHQLFANNYDSFSRNDAKLAGKIVDTYNTVKRKPANNLAWKDAHDSDQLFYSDKVYTHKNSNTKILFNNDLIIDLQENTLLQITENDNTPQIVLKDGVIYLKFTSKQDSKLKVVYKKKTFNITSASSELAITAKDSSIQVSSLSGNATVSA